MSTDANDNSFASIDARSLAAKCVNLYDSHASEEDSPIYSEIRTVQNRYEHLEEVGRGGMKRVSRVHDQITDRHIAYAELRQDLSLNAREIFLRERFLREARLTALLKHPNIIAIHDIGLNDQGSPYFTMDLKPGHSLAEILGQLLAGNQTFLDRYPLSQRLQLFSKVCDATGYAHAQHVIHLDIKPENIQIGDFGEVLLCDWGLGRILPGRETLHGLTPGSPLSDISKEDLVVGEQILNHMTGASAIQGTPGFMPPEQFDPEGHKDQRCDIYALGCLLYTLCSLHPPYEGSHQQIMDKTKHGEVPPLRETPRSLIAIINKAMHLNPDERYASVAQMQLDLNRYHTGYPTVAEKAPPLSQLSFFFKRHQQIALISLFALFLISILSGMYLINLNIQNALLRNKSAELAARNIETEQARKQAEAAKTDAESARQLEAQARQQEVKARQLAESNQARAEYVSSQYRKEKQNVESVMKSLQKRTMFGTSQLRENVYVNPITAINEAIHSAEQILSIDPKNEEAQTQMIILYFIMQDFKKVNKLLKQGYSLKTQFAKLAKEYAPLLQRRTLPQQHFNELIYQLARSSANTQLVVRMLAADQKLRGEQLDPIASLYPVLRAWHPEWDQKQISYDPKTLTLNINSPHLRILNSTGFGRWGVCILKHLKINHLNLSGSGVYDLGHFRLLDIQFMTIAGTNIDTVKPIHKMKLRALYVHEGQFTAEQLSVLPSHIQIKTIPK